MSTLNLPFNIFHVQTTGRGKANRIEPNKRSEGYGLVTFVVATLINTASGKKGSPWLTACRGREKGASRT